MLKHLHKMLDRAKKALEQSTWMPACCKSSFLGHFTCRTETSCVLRAKFVFYMQTKTTHAHTHTHTCTYIYPVNRIGSWVKAVPFILAFPVASEPDEQLFVMYSIGTEVYEKCVLKSLETFFNLNDFFGSVCINVYIFFLLAQGVLRSHVTECVGIAVRPDSCFLKALIRGTLMLNIANWKWRLPSCRLYLKAVKQEAVTTTAGIDLAISAN